jgi:hypothetical protein
MLRPENVRDQIGWVHPAAIRGPAFQIIDRLQRIHPTVQLTATAVALCAMAQECGISMRDLIVTAENTLRDCEGPYTEHVQAIRDYARNEILRGGA